MYLTTRIRPLLFFTIALISIALFYSCDGPGPGLNFNNSISVCSGANDFSDIPSAYVTALTRYTTNNSDFTVNVCTEDVNNDGNADYMVVESSSQPNHESSYFPVGHSHYSTYFEAFDYDTNIHKYADVYDGSQTPGPAGVNTIQEQTIVMRMPINPSAAGVKSATSFSTIGLALNGVSFFNENAAPGDNITDELFTFDQCSGHPQQQGIYHYHVDPVCLIRDLGGATNTQWDGSMTYSWLEDAGNNAGLLLGFLLDGFPVYGPVGAGETDCVGAGVPSIDSYNGHTHCTAEFNGGIYHYHVKTANLGGTGSPVFWITNEFYYGNPGSVEIAQ